MKLLNNDIVLQNEGNIYKLQSKITSESNFEDNPIYAPIKEFIKRFQMFADYELLDFYITFPKNSGIMPIRLSYANERHPSGLDLTCREVKTFDDLLIALECLDCPNERIWSVYVLFREPRG